MDDDYNNFVLQRSTLRNLDPSICNALIVGIIIAKQNPKEFFGNLPIPDQDSRAVLNFTLRDSPQDFINVSYWGRSYAIHEIDANVHVGDVVELVAPRILIRKYNDPSEQYRPKVTSPYTLVMSEQSKIVRHQGENIERFKHLLRLPTKPPGFVPIRDIHNGGLAIKDTYADILGAIAHIGTPRSVKLKSGSEAQLIEVTLFDQTHPGIRVSIWSKEYMMMASNWKQRHTILFITDVRIDWSAFHNCVVGKVTSRSILTQNPLGKEAENLARFALTAPLEANNVIEQLVVNLPNIEMIQDVMSVRQVQNKMTLNEHRSNGIQFGAFIYATVTRMDLDGYGWLISRKCGHCKSLLKTTDLRVKCQNEECPVAQNKESIDPEVSFDIRMEISDHTGRLSNCRLAGNIAENVLGCTVHEFLKMSQDQREKLKWKYLLERCALRVLILSVSNNKLPIISVQSCCIADSLEVAEKIPVY